jgi:hypothetical protein
MDFSETMFNGRKHDQVSRRRVADHRLGYRVASAQTYATAKAATANGAGAMHKEGDWRASKLIGLNVYNDANEKIGDINDVILESPARSRTSSWALADSWASANITLPSPMTA